MKKGKKNVKAFMDTYYRRPVRARRVQPITEDNLFLPLEEAREQANRLSPREPLVLPTRQEWLDLAEEMKSFLEDKYLGDYF